ncbi:MAG: hypothetical protein F6K50_52580 [Moorea sp. SIO3I7]|uniref:hypothetical protein n=1 Tax=Moorena sp. SIO4A1 TaxID=2607835 RepID=UPI0013C6E4C2|nr:hypothetical protein [Moorena sp. SIO4A1]NEO03628.1 hypothetical protein [Moorena sp. SIO3I7]NEO49050.1 hypothetical protein [Moorena sp. SIO4A3]NEQ63585.1 hypothetical protein [Moorena sp. SIO4A1]
MSHHLIFRESRTQVYVPVKIASSPPSTNPKTSVSAGQLGSLNHWMFVSIGLALVVIGLVVYGKLQFKDKDKKLKLEQYKTADLRKKLKLALNTIRKMESNPDLVHSREFNLDYLRMRMEEEVFHFAVINQIKIRIKQLISIALRPTQDSRNVIGVASTSGRQINETFDVKYETEIRGKRSVGVLFRIQVKLMKLPTQRTSATVSQIIDCIETFLSPDAENDTWQPTIQGRIVCMRWDQKAKPTPLLVLEQSTEGVNVTLRTKRVGMT